MPEWCFVLELNYHLVRRRIRDGWTFDEAIYPIKSINADFDGLTKPLHVWCEFLNLKYQETYRRIQMERYWMISLVNNDSYVRIHNQDDRHREIDNHTVLIYF